MSGASNILKRRVSSSILCVGAKTNVPRCQSLMLANHFGYEQPMVQASRKLSTILSESPNGETFRPSSLKLLHRSRESVREKSVESMTYNEKIDVEASDTVVQLQEAVQRNPTPLSLSNMYRYASSDPVQRLRNAQFLHTELLIRTAQRAMDLLTLPHGLSNTRQVKNIAHKYILYFRQLKSFPVPKNDADELKFTEILSTFVSDRSSIPTAIAAGVSSLRDERREALDDTRLLEMEDALYRFFTARVGLRFLTEHHILSKKNDISDNLRAKRPEFSRDFSGCIQIDCDPLQEVKEVSKQVREQCIESFGVAPQIEVVDCTKEKYQRKKFTYVPHHLQYMLAELIKNSCRATVKKHAVGSEGSSNDNLPPIRVVVVKAAEDVTIKIADQGGGVPRSEMDRIWTFAHSSLDASQNTRETLEFATDQFTGGTIRGFGLPLARIYARYFGGELTLKSMEGYGLDAYLYLPVLGSSCENLPKRVNFSPGNLDSVAASLTPDLLFNNDKKLKGNKIDLHKNVSTSENLPFKSVYIKED